MTRTSPTRTARPDDERLRTGDMRSSSRTTGARLIAVGGRAFYTAPGRAGIGQMGRSCLVTTSAAIVANRAAERPGPCFESRPCGRVRAEGIEPSTYGLRVRPGRSLPLRLRGSKGLEGAENRPDPAQTPHSRPPRYGVSLARYRLRRRSAGDGQLETAQ